VIKVEISFSNPADLVAFFTSQQVAATPRPAQAGGGKYDEPEHPAEPAVVIDAPVKRARRTKAEIAADQDAQAQVASNSASSKGEPSGVPYTPEAAAESPVIVEAQTSQSQASVDADGVVTTEDDVRSALAAYNGEFGMDEARALLAKFGAKRISEVKQSDYAAFIETARNRP